MGIVEKLTPLMKY